MPYTGITDESLPDNVKALTDPEKERWITTFNSAYETCAAEGGDMCEETAFSAAWGTIKEAAEDVPEEEAPTEESPPEDETPPEEEEETEPASVGASIMIVMEKIGAWLADLLGEKVDEGKKKSDKEEEKKKQRALSIPAMWDHVYLLIAQKDPNAFINDLFYDDDGMFAVITSGGKLFNVPLIIKKDDVTLGTYKEITLETKSMHKSNFIIRQVEENIWRWFSISGCSALNRSGQIDSRDLFDSMIAHADTTGEYPVRVFYHCDANYRTGQTDFLAREGNLLISSGLYDDTELARREIEARQKDPEFWGDSIGFLPTKDPVILRTTSGVEIPTYTEGVCVEISTLPEDEAASWMTSTPTLKKERTMNETKRKAWTKLWNDDEEAAEAWLEEHAQERNQLIEDAGMITRTEGAPDPDPAPAGDPPEDAPILDIDDTLIGVIATRVADGLDLQATLTPILDPIATAIEDLNTRMVAIEQGLDDSDKDVAEAISEIRTQVDALCEDEETKKRTWLNDLPQKPLQVRYRPRKEKTTRPPEEKNFEEVAAKTMESFPVNY